MVPALSKRRSITFQLEQVFPDDVYASMLTAMPEASDLSAALRPKPMQRAGGWHTYRVKIDLFPEYIRHLPPEKRMVWDVVGRALCSESVKAAFVRKACPGAGVPVRAELRQSGHVSNRYPHQRRARLQRSIRILIRAGRELPCNSFCRATRRILTSARSSTKSCPMAACQNGPR